VLGHICCEQGQAAMTELFCLAGMVAGAVIFAIIVINL
jgi:hypothetical protein